MAMVKKGVLLAQTPRLFELLFYIGGRRKATAAMAVPQPTIMIQNFMASSDHWFGHLLYGTACAIPL
jgi:hypothetical protein